MLSALALGACAQAPVRTLPVMLPLPARPVLTPVTSSELECLTPAAYTTIVNRERALKTWGLQLEAVIEANNQHAAAKGK